MAVLDALARCSCLKRNCGANFPKTMVRLARQREEFRVVADQVGVPTSAQVIADPRDAGRAKPGRMLEGRGHREPRPQQRDQHGFATAMVDGLRARDEVLRYRRIAPIRNDEFPTKVKRPASTRLRLRRLRGEYQIDLVLWRGALASELY